MNTTEWAAVGSGAAAIAAAASWASVWQNRRDRLLAQKPAMVIEVSERLPSRRIQVQLHNDGGTARGVRFCVLEGEFMAYGTPEPTGIFRAGESRTIETSLVPTGDRTAKAWVGCVDLAARYLYVVSSKGEQHRYRLRWPRRKLTDRWITKRLYDIDAEKYDIVGHETVDRGHAL